MKWNKKYTLENFIKKAQKMYKNKYDYHKSIYINAHIKIEIICPIHGSFFQLPSNHLSNHGCPKCVGKSKTTDDIIIEFRKIHGNKYDYSLINYKDAHTKIYIICPKHGKFFQRPNHHLCGSGCPKCSNSISKAEIEFLDYLNIPNTKENRQLKIKKFNVDGYDPKTNTIYEFLGDYWHGNLHNKRFNPKSIHPIYKITFQKLYEKTIKKLNRLKSLGYNVKYIWENDWKKFKNNINEIPKIIQH